MPEYFANGFGCRETTGLGRYLKHAALFTFCAALIGFVAPEKVLATIPDSSGIYHGCVKIGTNGRQTVYLIDTAITTTCSKGYSASTWLQIGPQGAAGPSGPPGPQGAAGALGSRGTARSPRTTRGARIQRSQRGFRCAGFCRARSAKGF